MRLLSIIGGVLAFVCMIMGILTFLGEPEALIDSMSGVLSGALTFYEFWFWLSALLFLATIALVVARGRGGGEEY